MNGMKPDRPPLLSFEVCGEPAPQGSKKHVGGGRLVESSKRLHPWRELVTWSARSAAGPGWKPIEGPVVVAIEFYKRRPKGHPKSSRTVPTSVTGDLDKLARGVCDALTFAGIYGDDSQVVDALLRARYATDRPELALPWELADSGARIAVWALGPEETWDDAPLVPLELVTYRNRMQSLPHRAPILENA